MEDFLGLLLVKQIRAKIKDLKVTFDLTILACIYENTQEGTWEDVQEDTQEDTWEDCTNFSALIGNTFLIEVNPSQC